MRRPDRRPHAVQLGLFRRHQRKPEWRDLPAEVREKTTEEVKDVLPKLVADLERLIGGQPLARKRTAT